MADDQVLVCSFISRGMAYEPGQGLELLQFTPAQYRVQPYDSDHLALCAQVTVSANDDLEAASAKSVTQETFLSKDKDLRLIRKGKKLGYLPGLFLVSFLWRLMDTYERGLLEEEEEERARAHQREPRQLPYDEATRNHDIGHFLEVEVKLGIDCHSWFTFAEIDDLKLLPRQPSNFVTTGYYCVVLAQILDDRLHKLKSLERLTPDHLSQLCLTLTYDLLSKQVARHAFTFWPEGVKKDPGTNKVPDQVLKFRVYAYFVDVVLHHLRQVRPSHDTSTATAFLNAFKPLRPLLSDPGVSLEKFEKTLAISLTREVESSKRASSLLERLACGRILETSFIPGAKRPLLHIITLGFNPCVFGTLRELIHYLLTVSSHPYSNLNPDVGERSKQDELKWLQRPDHLRITICESRPTGDGVAMAGQLLSVIETSSDRAKQLRELTRSQSDPYGIRAGPLAASRAQLEALMRELPTQQAGVYGTLEDLLGHAEAKSTPHGASKVTIDVAPDASILSVIKSAEPGVIILLGADTILPEHSDIVAAPGSFVLAHFGKEVKATVFALATTGLIDPSFKAKSPTSLSAASVSTTALSWSSFEACRSTVEVARMTDELVRKAWDPDVETISVVAPSAELVPASLINGYLTEKGLLSATACAEIGIKKAVEEDLICGKVARWPF